MGLLVPLYKGTVPYNTYIEERKPQMIGKAITQNGANSSTCKHLLVIGSWGNRNYVIILGVKMRTNHPKRGVRTASVQIWSTTFSR